MKINLPTKLTILRIVFVPICVAIFLIDIIPYNKIIATCIFALASITDWADGYIARKYNLITDLGKFLDPIADKILVNAAALMFIFDDYDWANNNYSSIIKLAFLIIALVFVSREMIISGFRLIAVRKNIVLAADKIGKIKTVLQMLGTLIVMPLYSIYSLVDGSQVVVILLYIGICVLLLSAIISVVSCANYIISNKQVLITDE